MIGENVLLVAKEDGHSAQTMLSTYAAWGHGRPVFKDWGEI